MIKVRHWSGRVNVREVTWFQYKSTFIWNQTKQKSRMQAFTFGYITIEVPQQNPMEMRSTNFIHKFPQYFVD